MEKLRATDAIYLMKYVGDFTHVNIFLLRLKAYQEYVFFDSLLVGCVVCFFFRGGGRVNSTALFAIAFMFLCC